jgi:very-short-patch-repair endonuclease
MPHEEVPARLRARSKALRLALTPPERKLWQALRGHRFLDMHFRRQVAMGWFIADFVCHARKLVIEIDGWTHSGVAAESHDVRRDRWFESRGYRVLRLPNDLLTRDLDSALRTTEAALDGDEPPSPVPSPARGEGKRDGGVHR